MRNLTADEQSYVEYRTRAYRRKKRFLGLLILLISTIVLYIELPGILTSNSSTNLLLWGLVLLSMTALGLFFLIASSKQFSRGSLTNLSGAFTQRKVKGSTGNYIQYIGSTPLKIPSAWVSCLEPHQEYTAEVYRGKEGILGFPPLVLKIKELPQDLKNISLMEMSNKEKAIIKMALLQLFTFGFMIAIPFLLVFFFVQYGIKSSLLADFLTAHDRETQSLIEYLGNHDFTFKLIQFFFQNFMIFFILFMVIIVFIVKSIAGFISSRSAGPAPSAGPYQSWIDEYKEFMFSEFGPVMQRHMNNDSSVVMDYMDVVNRRKQYRKEFSRLKKTLNKQERSQLINQMREIQKHFF